MGAIATVVLGAVLARRPHRRPAAASTPARSCSCRACAPASASTSPSSTAPSPARFAAAVRPGRTMLVFAETPANPQLDAHRPRRAGRHRGPVHRGRLHVRHADRPAAARPRRRPRAPLGHQGHRRPQRRHARRRRRQRRRCSTRLWSLRRPARRLRVAVRRHERAAGHPHAAGAHRAPERDRPAPGRVRWRPTRPSPACATRASPSHPQHDLAKRQMAYGGSVLAVDLAGGLDGRAGASSRACGWPAWPRRSAVPRRSSSARPTRPTSGCRADELAAAGIGPGPRPRLGRPRAPRRPAGRLRARADR